MRNLITAFGIVATALAADPVAAFPDRPLNYIIPFDPGGESDVSARMQTPFFQEITGQDLIIQYMPGAGGAQAWASLKDQPADGHTIMGTNLPHIILQPMLQEPGYETEDIVNVYIFQFTPHALLVRQDSPYQTLEEVIAQSAENPGSITVSGTGTNSANHVENQVFENETGAQLTYIPYSGTASATTAVMGGETDASWGFTTVLARQPELRALAVAMEERHPLFPDVPTFRELGYDIVGGAHRGIAVPASTPEETRQALSDIIGQINADPDFIQQMEEDGFAMIDVPYSEVGPWMGERKVLLESVAEQLAE